MPFHSRNDLLIRTSDGRNCVLQEPLEFVTSTSIRYRVPVSSTTDGISTPSAIWVHYPPFGPWWLAGVVHDAAYRGSLEVFRDESWIKALLSKDDSDALFLEALESLGISLTDRTLLYQGVHIGGWKAFDKNREKP